MFHASSKRLVSIPAHLHQPHRSFRLQISRRICISSPHHQNRTDSYQPFSLSSNDLLDFFNHKLQQCTIIQHTNQIHAQIVTTGSYRFAFLAARLVSVYAGFRVITNAQKVFETMPVECFSNLLLWNSILRANVGFGHYEEVFKLYLKMRKVGVFGDGFTFPLVIRACGLMGSSENLCKIVHTHVLQMGFQFHLHCANELMGMYGKLGKMDDARKVFDRMIVRSHLSWNTMVSGFAHNHDSDGALEIFQRMEAEGLEPNNVTWTSLLSGHARCGRHEETIELFGMMRMRGIGANAEAVAVVLSVCADLGALNEVKVIHGHVIKGGFEDYLFVKNSLIFVYGKKGNVKDAQSLFLEMENKDIVSWNSLISCYAESGFCDDAFAIFLQLENSSGNLLVRPDVVSWSAVIDGFASTGRGEESLEVFRRMQLANVMANSVTICSVLSVCAELAALFIGREIHGYAIRALINSNILVGNGLISMYTKCGSIKEGHSVFEKINCKDLITWNSMITGYGMHGFGEMALETFNQMINSAFKPDEVTFVAVLSACSHAGLVSEGRKIFYQMTREFRIEPQMEHFACMVDLLGRAGNLQEASEIVKNMPMKPNAGVWGALLNSCRMHKNTEVAEETASHIFNLNSETTGSYMLLSNIYAASGRYEDSARVRISAKKKGLKKIAGQSWIEIKKKVYMFSAGNAMQMGMEEVYEILQNLVHRMEIEGYKHDKSCLLQDADE